MTIFCKPHYLTRVGDLRTLKLTGMIRGEFCIGWFRVTFGE